MSTLATETSTLFQVSTSMALVKGVYTGAVTIAELKEHGDLGLGTFADLDGEMLVLDGRFYRLRGANDAAVADDGTPIPFAVVTKFRPDRTVTIDHVDDVISLLTHLDGLRRSLNLYYAVRIEGHFTRVEARAVRKTEGGVSLLEAASRQAEFTFTDVTGTLAGFWSPAYATTLSIPGWHLHFVNSSRSGGGHLLACEGDGLQVRIQELSDLEFVLPKTPAFLQADLSQDLRRALDVAERTVHH